MKKSYVIAILIVIVSVLWIGSGLIVSNDDMAPEVQQAQTEQPSSKVMKVQVDTVSPEAYTNKITVNGRSEASKNVTIRAEAEGQIIAILHEEGDTITKGQNIVKIDIQERNERVREARELMKQRKIEFDAAKRLIKEGFASDVRLAQTQSAYESARAGLKRAEIDLAKTVVEAPFDGILGKRAVDIGDYVRVGDAVTDIVDLDPLEVAVFVNEKEVVQLQKGNEATLRFAGGETRDGQVEYIAPSADEDSRTFRVTVTMDNSENQLPAGLTAQVDISVNSKQAYKIPPSVMTLDDEGAVGVKTVSNDNIVAFTPITIIEDTPDHLWVTGLEGDVQIVIVGQDFIVPGQEVEPIENEDNHDGDDV